MNCDALLATRLVELALLALVFTGARLILRRTLAALVVVVPLALLIPWRVPLYSVAASAVVLPLAASALWLWWLANEKPSSARPLLSSIPLALATLVATALTFLAPQLLLLSSILSLYYLVRRASPSRFKPLAAFVLLPLAYRTGVTLAATGSPPSALRELASSLSSGRTMRGWFQASGTYVYRDAVFQLNMLFYLPVLLGLAAIAPRFRRQWWFAPTFLWAAVLALSPIVFEHSWYFHYSQPMQIALLLPSGLLGFLFILERPPSAVSPLPPGTRLARLRRGQGEGAV